MSIFIDDGYSLTKTIPAAAAYPAVTVVYRPVLHRERRIYSSKLATSKPEQFDDYECELLAKQVHSIDGASLKKDQFGKLHPVIFAELVSLVLGYSESDENAASKNSSSA